MATNWTVTRLEAVARIRHGYAFPGSLFSDDPRLPILVTPGNFALGGGFQDAKTKSFRGEIPRDFVLAPGSLVVTMTDLSKNGDTLGYPAWIPDDGRTYLHNQRVGLVECDLEMCLPSYLYYLMMTGTYRHHVLGGATGSTVRHTSPSRILSFAAMIPPLDVQAEIVASLTAMDDLRYVDARIRATSLQLSRHLFRQLSEGADGRVRLSELCDVNPDRVRRAEDRHISYVQIGDVGDGLLDWGDPKDWKKAPAAARLLAREGDTVWSRVRPNRKSHALVLSSPAAPVITTGMVVLRPRRCSSSVLFAVTDTDDFRDQLVGRSAGTAYPTVGPEDFPQCTVPNLRADDQRLLSEAMDPLWRAVGALQAEARALEAARNELLPLLMSGRVHPSEVTS